MFSPFRNLSLNTFEYSSQNSSSSAHPSPGGGDIRQALSHPWLVMMRRSRLLLQRRHILRIHTGLPCLPYGNCCVCAKLLKLCLILCDLMEYSLPSSSFHGILQARIVDCRLLLQGIDIYTCICINVICMYIYVLLL